MDYQTAIDRLFARGPELRTGAAARGLPPQKFSLDLIRTLLEALGEPQQSFRSVLIAGTNGKGSTAATLASILRAADVRTGLYTSPHLLRPNERMRVADTGAGLEEIPDADFGRLYGVVDETAARLVAEGRLPHGPSFFEHLTAMAFLYFAERGVAWAVLEVGLGGRLDATNAVEPAVSVITDIGLDHTEFLGDTITAITREKAGILRPDGVLVTLSQHPEANAAIGERAVELGVRGVDASRFLPPRGFAGVVTEWLDEPFEPSPLGRNRYAVTLEGEPLLIDSPLSGHHQQRNVALALACAVELRTNHGVAISNRALEDGVRGTVWPGRLEWIARPYDPRRPARPPLLLDVAHNPAGAWTLRSALSALPDERPRTLIFSCLADKQVEEMARILLPLFDPASGDPARVHDHIVLAPIQSPRAATVEQLLAVTHALDIPAHAAPHLPGALREAEQRTPPGGLIVATGSVYLVGELRELALRPVAPVTMGARSSQNAGHR